jgi:hypothetical protein
VLNPEITCVNVDDADEETALRYVGRLGDLSFASDATRVRHL